MNFSAVEMQSVTADQCQANPFVVAVDQNIGIVRNKFHEAAMIARKEHSKSRFLGIEACKVASIYFGSWVSPLAEMCPSIAIFSKPMRHLLLFSFSHFYEISQKQPSEISQKQLSSKNYLRVL